MSELYICRQTERQTDIQTYRQNAQTEGQIDRTNKQMDRLTDSSLPNSLSSIRLTHLPEENEINNSIAHRASKEMPRVVVQKSKQRHVRDVLYNFRVLYHYSWHLFGGSMCYAVVNFVSFGQVRQSN